MLIILSLFFPIDLKAQATAFPDTPLQWVTEFKYLGVVISRQASDFLPLNLMPVVQEVRKKLKAWGTLPLSLLGRINLIEMKILQKCIYLFQNSPQWLPKSFFTRLDSIFSILIMEESVS